MSLKEFFFILLFAVYLKGFSQIPVLSPASKISIITCGPGNEAYSIFGHSAIRVQDSTQGIDVAYNYGMFDFTTPNFLLKFARGRLDYMLGRQTFPYFLRSYELENRWVKEQQLELNLDERKELFQFLETNYLPENRNYKYEFFYNNCSTKIWDVLKAVYGDELVFDENYLDSLYTHRQLIRQNVQSNSWLGFGIDLALGSVIDDTANAKEHMFLPVYTMQQLELSQLASKPLTASPKVLFDAKPMADSYNFFVSPAFWLFLLLIAVLVLTYFDFKNNTRRRWLDFILFFVTGTAGLIIIFLWFFTDHTATVGNFNMLWAFPLNFLLALIVARKKGPNWVTTYAVLAIVLIVICVVLWLFKIQIFSPLIVPIWLALCARYLFLYWSYQKPKLV